MLAAVCLCSLLAVAQAQAQEPETEAPIPDEVIVVWGSVEARKELELSLWDMGYRAQRSRRGDRVILRSYRRDMPTVILHDSGWMEIREGAFQARTPTGKILARALALNFVNPRKVLQAKGRLVERTWPQLTLWQAALAAEGAGDPSLLPTGAELDAALAALGRERPELSRPEGMPDTDALIASRGHMVDFRLAWSGLANLEVQEAIRAVPRETFLERERWAEAYEDKPLEDPDGRPVAAPSRVAWQLKSAGVRAGERVLELSRESGYRGTVLAALGALVWRVDEEPAVAFAIAERSEAAGQILQVVHGPLAAGWAAAAPFDLIIIEDSPGTDPGQLASQLLEGGRTIVIRGFELLHYTLEGGVLHERRFLPLGNTLPGHDVEFVPDVGVPGIHIEEHNPGFEPPAFQW
jgi:protein-L-isoaspartate(D-aspartate) O-methyltransferase